MSQNPIQKRNQDEIDLVDSNIQRFEEYYRDSGENIHSGKFSSNYLADTRNRVTVEMVSMS